MALSGIEGLIKKCKRNKKFYVYGAGKNAKCVYLFFKSKEIKVQGFIVSDPAENPEILFDLPVTGIENCPKKPDTLIVVSIVKGSMAYIPVFNCLVEHGLHNVLFISSSVMVMMRNELKFQKLQSIFDKETYRLGQDIPAETNHSIFAMPGMNGMEYHWRVKEVITEQFMNDDEVNLFSNGTPLEEFEKQYGKYYILHALETDDVVSEKTYSVYMAQSHVDRSPLQCRLAEWITPIQVGAALTEEKICRCRDDIGTNISDRNVVYSECTALYWMWKNAPKTDYIGLCHYRRHFDISENDWEKMAKSDIDVLVTTPTFINEGIGTFFALYLSQADIEQLLKAIESCWPEYLPTAREFLKARFFPPCNLAIMKYELFQKYSEFVFSITFKIEDYFSSLHFYREDRYMGYLIECLLGIFLMYHKEELKIAYTDMLFYS